MWRTCVKPLQIWWDFAALCPEPTLAPQGGQEPLERAVDGDAAPQEEISSCCWKATLAVASFVSIQTQQIVE